MDKLDKNKIERIAAEAVRTEANHPKSKLIANVTESDKGISFDGDITIFKFLNETVDSFLGKVPVQIKGTQVDEFSNNIITFSIELGHIKNYYNSNGVILFVVEVLGTGVSKIYYKQLLPKELFEIINVSEEKKIKSTTIKLRPLSETSLYVVCVKFFNEIIKQPQMLIENNPFPEDSFSTYSLSSLTYNPSNLNDDAVFDHDFTVYGLYDKLTIPLHHIMFNTIESMGSETFNINGNTHSVQVKTRNQKEKLIRIIENNIEIVLNKKTNKIKITLKPIFTSLALQLKIVPFLIDLLTSLTIDLKEGAIVLKNYSQKQSKWIKTLEKYYFELIQLRETFNILGIDENIVILDYDNSLSENSSLLVELILKNNTNVCTIHPAESPNFIEFSLGDIYITLFYDHNHTRKVISGFSDDILNKSLSVTPLDDDTSYGHSIFLMLTGSLLARSSNINFQIIKESFNKFNPFLNDFLLGHTNKFCLECITAYDISNNVEFLLLAEYILTKYIFEPTNITLNYAIIMVNLYQTRFRIFGTLSANELANLLILKNNENIRNEISLQLCVNVLLKNKSESEFYFQQMDPNMQLMYNDYPIFKLYNMLNTTN